VILRGPTGRGSAADYNKVHILFQHPFKVFLNPWLDAVRPCTGTDAGHVPPDDENSPQRDDDDDDDDSLPLAEGLVHAEQAVLGDQQCSTGPDHLHVQEHSNGQQHLALEPFHLSPLAPASVVPQSVQATAMPSSAQPMYYSNDSLRSGAVDCITRIAHAPRVEAGTWVSPVGSTQALETYTNGSTVHRAGTHSTNAGLQLMQQPLPYPSTIVRDCDTAAVGYVGFEGIAMPHEATLRGAEVPEMIPASACEVHKRQRLS
jgi:hypothetical protein